MYRIKRTFLAFVFVTVAAAQSLEPPLLDSRLSVHTLVREDIFAGPLTNEMERFSRGKKNIQLLLEQPRRKTLFAGMEGECDPLQRRARTRRQPHR